MTKSYKRKLYSSYQFLKPAEQNYFPIMVSKYVLKYGNMHENFKKYHIHDNGSF